jgi:molecular chaperone GrpE (heat shock protein)
MAERRRNGGSQIDALYQWISYDLQKMRADLLKEMQMSSTQVGSLYNEIKEDNKQSSDAIAREIRYGYKQNQNVYDGLSSIIKDEVSSKLDNVSGEKIEELLNEVSELKYSYQQLQAAYEGIEPKMDSLAEKVEKLDELSARLQEVCDKFDLTAVENQLADINAKLADGCGITEEDLVKVAEKTEESVSVHSQKVLDAVAAIPVAENVDYVRIVDEVGDRVLELLNESREATVEGTSEKVVESMPYPEKLDYDRLADMVAEKLAAKMQQNYDVVLDEAGLDAIADKVVAKMGAIAIDYDKVCLAAQAAQVVTDPVDYDRIGEIVEDKLAGMTCNVVLETPVEEVVAEEPVVEEVAVVEEPVVEEPATEEIAVAVAPAPELPIFNGDEMVDAETGLIIRLKKSFTAKMKQSEDDVKAYYSDIKNELTSYNRINSNVSWHGDRFNFGRDTVAKMTIVGKTLNLYLALDPNDPEFKTTVYHQKDVGAQKAYESTPFMVKVKSDAAAKKALRLVAALAEKLATEKDGDFVAVDYKAEFAYESTKALFEAGFIKATKEKKVDLDTI